MGVAVHQVLRAWNRARWRQEAPSPHLMYAAYTAAWIAGQVDEPVAWESPVEEEEQKQVGWRLAGDVLSGDDPPVDRQTGRGRSRRRSRSVRPRTAPARRRARPRAGRAHHRLQDRRPNAHAREGGVAPRHAGQPPTRSCTGRTPAKRKRASRSTTCSSSSSPGWWSSPCRPAASASKAGFCGSSTLTSRPWSGATSFPLPGCNAPPASSWTSVPLGPEICP